MREFIIYTDGSATSMSNGGSACIVQDVENLQNYNLMASYRESTNNQAELFATFLGYEFIKQFVESNPKETNEVMVTVVSDSEYVLAGSTQYVYKWLNEGKFDSGEVKNPEFWKAFLKIKGDFKIYPEHIKGHKGHGENEKCDYASGWCRKNHEKGFMTETFVELQYPKKRKQKVPKTEFWFYMNLDEAFQLLKDGDLESSISLIDKAVAKSLVFENPKMLTLEERLIEDMAHKIYEAAALGTKYKHQLKKEKCLEYVERVTQLYIDLEQEIS